LVAASEETAAVVVEAAVAAEVAVAAEAAAAAAVGGLFDLRKDKLQAEEQDF
jgi:hypothetical protein